MKIVTAAEMRQIDRATTERFGVPSLTLMENAGSAVARFALRQYPGAKRITIVCGKGNNGGDGFVAGRKLHEAGRDVSIVLLASPEEVKGDAREMLRRLPLSPVFSTSVHELDKVAGLFRHSDLILDAIFGTGFRPPLPELAGRAIQLIAESPAPVLSVDLPSGADADSFAVDQPAACRSDAVVTFTALKPGIVFSTITRGPIVVAGIGSPPGAITSELGLEWNSPPEILREKRRLNSHKGLYGHTLIVGGSIGKSGAPTMASMAALRIGAGLVTCAVPKSILPIVAGSIPELMTEPLDENAVGIARHAFNEGEVRSLLSRKNVAAIGPGIGRDPDTVQAVHEFIERCNVPVIIDADGLNAFRGELSRLDRAGRPLVLTPHPGEMAYMLCKTVTEVEADRVEIARWLATKANLILVLKGWRTLIAAPDGNVWVNTTGNPGLAKGGSGDVLTGMIAGLVAQYPKPIVEAVRGAVYLHGLAADLAVERETERAMLATDVIASLASAFRKLGEPADEFTWIQGEAQRR